MTPPNVTLAAVNRAIRHLGIRAHRGRGYYYWTAATKETERLEADLLSVYVNSASQLTLEQWVKEAECAITEAKKSNPE